MGREGLGQAGVQVQVHDLDGVQQRAGGPVRGQRDGGAGHPGAAVDLRARVGASLQERDERGHQPAPVAGVAVREQAAGRVPGQVAVQEEGETGAGQGQ
ncbi:hypothetical protein [Nocardiopsis sp. CNR-923]|uniref:hypothetical protein n=1 Tax=Nocardiopsis sp. CNR-923 TaxID=1904965 RepID=UPI0021CCABE2